MAVGENAMQVEIAGGERSPGRKARKARQVRQVRQVRQGKARRARSHGCHAGCFTILISGGIANPFGYCAFARHLPHLHLSQLSPGIKHRHPPYSSSPESPLDQPSGHRNTTRGSSDSAVNGEIVLVRSSLTASGFVFFFLASFSCRRAAPSPPPPLSHHHLIPSHLNFLPPSFAFAPPPSSFLPPPSSLWLSSEVDPWSTVSKFNPIQSPVTVSGSEDQIDFFLASSPSV
ncbi:hypothetical protein BO70DRAFT_26663 [Aspergillus heteromorphus CBS 117.55]|uniref:Uncharacterized protein n=1 Tax=Aspergillus heteromorphus CBS 117.55 TaxID=1448321 RepID=A0A317WDU0_9EURO|nr:uncharacterized protein BO70DRAFT_26663 [Aspergillus heteromorphus CBS 117.55]PWY83467.1 hypothetical protein BO70DRAFT_26663 [Aspergillus heteromorphus CBS 117.55]